MDADTKTNDGFDAYLEIVGEQSPYLFCDNCGAYPLEPVHGHFMCNTCYLPTKCCEGGAQNL